MYMYCILLIYVNIGNFSLLEFLKDFLFLKIYFFVLFSDVEVRGF